VWCSREILPAAAAQPAKARQSCSATDLYIYIVKNGQLLLRYVFVNVKLQHHVLAKVFFDFQFDTITNESLEL
jgi:hypothetical protein